MYEKPYDPDKPMVVIDEKTNQLHEDARKPLPMKPGKCLRQDYEYKRNGMANIFVGGEPKTGQYFSKVTRRKTAIDFGLTLADIEKQYQGAKKIDLVMDNLNTHSLKSLIKTFGTAEGERIWKRFDVHYTPKHASWLNQAEIVIGMLSGGCLNGRRFSDFSILEKNVAAWLLETNKSGIKINWKFTRKKARKKFGYKPKKELRI